MKLNLRLFSCVLLALLGASSLVAQPTISSFSPNSGYYTMPTQITITGSGFTTGAGNTVRFNGVLAASFSSTTGQIQATVPSGATTGRITVQVGAGPIGQSVQDFVVGPFIESFSPFSAGPGTTVTLNGAQFQNASSPVPVVKFNGSNVVSGAINSDSLIQAVVPNNAMTGPITISIASGPTVGTYTTLSNFFVPPTITGFSPPSSQAGGTVTIVGRSFAGVTAVRIGSITANIVSSDQTNIVITVPNTAVTGKISVDAPPNSTLTTTNFVVLPTILGFSPVKGNAGTNVVITGLSFNGTPANIQVKFNGTLAAILGTPSSTSITSTVPAGATSGPISVTTTNGTAVSSANFFLPPSISTVSPSNGGSGTVVTIDGLNLTNTTSVTFNGVNATGFTVVNNTQISATAPASTTGRIVVTTPGGSATNATVFSYPPGIASFTPASGLPGQTITLSGVNFTNATAVKFAGANAQSFAILSDAQITAIVPTNAVSGVLSVVAPGGTAASTGFFFIDTVKLTIQLVTNNLISVTWPTNTIGFGLESAANLLNTNTAWLPVTNPPVTLQNGNNTYTNVLDSTARFFRLKK